MQRVLTIIGAIVCTIQFAATDEMRVATLEFKRSPPANATTLRQYYRAINAISIDPKINGTLVLLV